MKQFLSIVAIGFLLAGCSPEFRAQQAEYFAKDSRATGYHEAGFFNKWGYREKDAGDANSIRINYTANGLTSRERHLNLIKYHAALLTKERGEEVFSLSGIDRHFVCRPIADIGSYMTAVARFGEVTSDQGLQFVADEVIADFGPRVNNPPDDYETRQRLLLTFTESCSAGHIMRPDSVTINSERRGN